MRIASPVELEETLIVARGRHRALPHIHVGNRLSRLATRILHRDPPGAAVRMRTDRSDIAAEIDQSVPSAKADDHCGCTIRCVFLADAAKVDLHTGMRQVKAGCLP